MNNVFGLDIGTRNVVGTVGYKTEDDEFVVVAQYIKEHETRAMLDGQIHDIARVGRTIKIVKEELEQQIGQPLEEVCIAAAGRVLKTAAIHVEYEYAEEAVVTGEDIHTLNLLGIEKAQDELKQNNDTKYKFYCVGYSTVKYFINDELFISIEGHKANKIGEDMIVTFLPEDVVDGLYSAVGQAGLTVANMTLEPIAAINIAIPENYRMLNIALVDVGAGTSDISITKDGSIVAYGMIPHAGDELTEVIVQHFLVDFKMAEHIKLESTVIPSSEVWDVVSSVVEKITTEVASKIKELNGGNTVSACFVVGGGGKVHGFTENLAKELDLPEERVALRGEEVLGEVTFQQPDIKKDPLLVTPIGICLNYYEQRNNFIMVRFNGERLKLYDNNRLTIVDAALQAGFPNDQLFPKRGVPINFTVNGASRIARGEAGEAAIVTMNGQHANINTPLEPNSEITIEPSTAGDDAVYTIGQLEEYRSSTIKFIVNGHEVTCPKFVQVNGSLEPETYHIKEGDAIEMRNFYTVEQVAEFMDVALEPDEDIYVNNAPATFDTLVYENFSINWKDDPYGVARRDDNIYTVTEENDGSEDDAEAVENEEISDETTESKAAGSDETSESKETGSDGKSESEETGSDGKSQSKETESDGTSENITAESDETAENESTSENKTAEDTTKTDETSNMYTPSSFTKQDGKSMVVTVNGEPVELIGKEAYIFVDIFNRITFDLNAGKGRAIATIINGRDAQFTEELHDGDKIELYWKEN